MSDEIEIKVIEEPIEISFPQGEAGGCSWGEIEGDLSNQTDLKTSLDNKADVIVSSASGSIVGITDAKASPVVGLTVGIEPVQDLHGQPSPYPAGGSRNMMPYATSDEISQYPVLDGDYYYYTLTGLDTTATFAISLYRATVSSESSTISRVQAIGDTSNNPITFNPSSTIGKVTITKKPAADGTLQIKIHKDFAYLGASFYNMQIEQGSSSSDYVPYSNICPISGNTSAVVTRTGKNLFPATMPDNAIHANYSGSAGTIASLYQATNAWIFAIPCKPNTDYTASVTTTGTSWGIMLGNDLPAVGNSVYIVNTMTNLAEKTFNTSTYSYIMIMVINTASFEELHTKKIMLEVGSAKTSYESPISPTEVTIALGQTVYGGTVDVLTGMLTITDAQIASYAGETLPSTWISDRDVYAAGTTPTTGAQVVYKLATPVTAQLTPATLNLLLGTNVIWADCGETSLTYKADMKLYIDGQISKQGFAIKRMMTTATTDMKAPKNLTNGEIIIVGDDLYKATSNIANGATLTVGSNVQKVTLAEWVASLV